MPFCIKIPSLYPFYPYYFLGLPYYNVHVNNFYCDTLFGLIWIIWLDVG
jgi:hypothetical protein